MISIRYVDGRPTPCTAAIPPHADGAIVRTFERTDLVPFHPVIVKDTILVGHTVLVGYQNGTKEYARLYLPMGTVPTQQHAEDVFNLMACDA